MTMLHSLSIQLAMFAATIGVVFWIGWQTPDSSPRGASPAASHVNVAAQPHVVDLNSATAQELESLPGIGAVLAERVIAYRKSVGRFRTVEDLREVAGIGSKKFDRLKPLVTVAAAETKRNTEKRPL